MHPQGEDDQHPTAILSPADRFEPLLAEHGDRATEKAFDYRGRDAVLLTFLPVPAIPVEPGDVKSELAPENETGG
jgi:hypothetical protein